MHSNCVFSLSWIGLAMENSCKMESFNEIGNIVPCAAIPAATRSAEGFRAAAVATTVQTIGLSERLLQRADVGQRFQWLRTDKWKLLKIRCKRANGALGMDDRHTKRKNGENNKREGMGEQFQVTTAFLLDRWTPVYWNVLILCVSNEYFFCYCCHFSRFGERFVTITVSEHKSGHSRSKSSLKKTL